LSQNNAIKAALDMIFIIAKISTG